MNSFTSKVVMLNTILHRRASSFAALDGTHMIILPFACLPHSDAKQIAEERPRVANVASLLAMPLASFLSDPHSVHEVRERVIISFSCGVHAGGVTSPHVIAAEMGMSSARPGQLQGVECEQP